MPKTAVPDLGIVLMFLRRGLGLSQAELGKAADISPNLLNDYEHGRKPLHRPRLEHIISFMGLTGEAIDRSLACLEENRAEASDPGAAPGTASYTRRRVQVIAAQAGRLATDFVRSALSLVTLEGETLQARQRAETLWARLKKRKPDERRVLVEESKKFRSWALCERVAAESIAVAPESPAQGLELAHLALLIAERCPGEEWLRQRAQGYAWFHVSNGRRFTNDFPGADHALASAKKLWDAGASGDPGLFNEAIVLALEANLHRYQRRFPLALRRIEEALAADSGEIQGKLLLTKARILEALGEIESSTETLEATLLYVDEQKEPRTVLGVQFQFLTNLCLQDRAVEAKPRLPMVRKLAERLGFESDIQRIVWLEGKVAAGLGQLDDAEIAFEQVRRYFAAQNLSFDYALSCLDLALILLAQARTGEVRTLAAQMGWLFKTQGLHVEALGALRVFCDAAKSDLATAKLADRVVRFLYRSQHDPDLTFEIEERGDQAAHG